MKRIILSILLLIGCLVAEGKTTYIPTYYSYIHLRQGKDTVSVMGNRISLEMLSFNKLFTVSVHHEDVTHEKVKAIKRAKAAAGWSIFNAVMSRIAPGERGSIFSRIQDSRLTSMLTKMDVANAVAEQVLEVEVWIDNNSDDELLVNDMIRGLAWYVQPHESLQFELANPDVASLRVSDVNNNNVEFVTVGAGNAVRKEFVSYENDECWVVDIYPSNYTNDMQRIPLAYDWINKTTFETKRMSTAEFRDFKKEMKRRNKEARKEENN